MVFFKKAFILDHFGTAAIPYYEYIDFFGEFSYSYVPTLRPTCIARIHPSSFSLPPAPVSHLINTGKGDAREKGKRRED